MELDIDMTDRIFEYAVVGAGVTGLKIATELAANRASAGRKVALIEAGQRTGGRLFSCDVTNTGLPIDFGGMRYRNTQQRTRDLIENELDLATRELPLSSGNKLYFLRGTILNDRDFSNAPDQLPFKISANFKGLTPPEMLSSVIQKLRENNFDEYSSSLCYRNVKEHHFGFWATLQYLLHPEDYACLLDGAGIGNGTVGAWDLERAFAWFKMEFDPTTRYRVIDGGFAKITHALEERFTDRGGVLLHGHRVKHIETQTDGSDTIFTLCCNTGSGKGFVRARAVVVTVPPVALKEIVSSSPALSPVLSAISQVTPQALTRLVLQFKEKWWKNLYPNLSRILTDLPVRQITFGIEPSKTSQNSGADGTFVLCSFNCVRHPGYWERLLENSIADSGFTIEKPTQLASDSPVVQSAFEQIKTCVGAKDAPQPVNAWLVDWNAPAYGGGWHTWNTGSDPDVVMQTVTHPIKHLNFHIGGEAFSSYQAWVEGSLESAERVLDSLN